ncbi:SGNH/GDSL hydrolase family protein [Fictibacillus sp. S7]|uniref:SGNH/GDSL hydrolase family protein n=1 Tax=Fictibacillus sp. S7 TaxID=2212476 RepID=UPI001013B6A5|nr:SGNH/GDSL hydrolase family protein [Fictibacillus sp. S7]RXZ01509.1 hypothetical protein DMO16_18690 [Fictibacillus sp. S7]
MNLGYYLALGDSITWASVTGTTKGSDFYAMKVRDAIAANYRPIKLVNNGIGGITSNHLVQNMHWCTRVVPDIVTIGIGMNDAVNGYVPVSNYKTNLQTVIDTLRTVNPTGDIILCTPSQTTDPKRSTIQNYRDAMAEVASANGMGLARFDLAYTYEEVATYSDDGVNPNKAGHQKIFDKLWKEVQKVKFLN